MSGLPTNKSTPCSNGAENDPNAALKQRLQARKKAEPPKDGIPRKRGRPRVLLRVPIDDEEPEAKFYNFADDAEPTTVSFFALPLFVSPIRGLRFPDTHFAAISGGVYRIS